MKRITLTIGVIIFSTILKAGAVEIPLKMNFQGVFSSGSVTLDFYITGSANSLDRLPSGSPWTEQVSTSTADGVINHILGSLQPIPRSLFTSLSTSRFLEMVIDGDSSFMELVSVPFAFRASFANELAGGSTVQGLLNIVANTRALHIRSSNDQILIEDSDGPVDAKKWIMKANSGDFEILTANDDLTGFAQVMRVVRSGVGVNSVNFPSGRLGVGTNNPQNALHVLSSNSNPRILIESSSNNSSPEINLLAKNFSGIQKSANIFHAQGDRLGIWMTDSGEVFDIKQNGNVGIGSTNPAFKLDVNGIINASDIYKNGAPLPVGGVQPSDDVVWTGLHTWLSSASFKSPELSVGTTLFVVTGGNVGVGTTSPSHRLDVNGIINASDIFKNGVPFTGISQWDDVTGGINFAGGNVGIGTNSPLRELHIVSGGVNPRILVESTANGSSPEINFLSKNASGDPKFANIFHAQGDRLGVWMTDSGEVFSIKQNGDVGIGTISPKARLNVVGTVTDAPAFWVDGSSHVLFTNSGSIGIGTTEPQGRLHISGAGEQEFVLTRTDLPDNPTFRFGRIILAGDGDPEFRFLYNDDNTPERVILEFDKKGIIASVKTGQGSHFEGFFAGDTDPVFRLNSFPSMQLEFGPGGSVVTDVAMRRVEANTLGFITGDTTQNAVIRMLIDGDGNVGIGTDDPQSALQVDGYLQLALTRRSPPRKDCNQASEAGRMKFDEKKNRLYVCSGKSGWTFTQMAPAHKNKKHKKHHDDDDDDKKKRHKD